MRLPFAIAALLAAIPSLARADGPKKRPLEPADISRIADILDLAISPDGKWIAYTVDHHDLDADEVQSDLWMTSWDGARTVHLTRSKASESTPRWSPDSSRLAFISARDVDSDIDQLFVLDLGGGDPEMITDAKGDVLDVAWSPDGRRLALVISDPDPNEAAGDAACKEGKKKTLPPLVIDRLQFKDDEVGRYLDGRRAHLYLFDLATKKLELLTPGAFNEILPAWSPDGSLIAFVSKRAKDIDRDDNWDILVIEPKIGAKPRPVTTFAGADLHPEWVSYPAWSPDSKWIAYLQGASMELIYYGVHQLAIAPVNGGAPRLLAPELDRNVIGPKFSKDGKTITFMIEDDRTQTLARIPTAGGAVERILDPEHDLLAFDQAQNGQLAILSATKYMATEVYALEYPGGREKVRPLSRQNEALFKELALGSVQETSFNSKDGTEIHGFIIKPVDWKPGKRHPAVLRIHGGPALQWSRGFYFLNQLLAGAGYVVIFANPRGSSGRGQAFASSIAADWGNKDAQDVLAAVDDAVARGLADPERLGIGGWSYGGILTNYVIAQSTRFKVAISGAGISNILAGYGTDQYIREYEYELGPPWKNPDLWIKLSFPFLHADKIVTPTLFMCGDVDYNVPLLNSEQMYQALRSLGRDTQLVIYPGEHHDIKRPSYQRDRAERYLAWYGKYLGKKK